MCRCDHKHSCGRSANSSPVAGSTEHVRVSSPEPAFPAALDELLHRLELGLPKAALGLTELPVALSRWQCVALFAVGAGTADAAKVLDQKTLTRCVDSVVAAAIRGKHDAPEGSAAASASES
jgi:hypothetical protein